MNSMRNGKPCYRGIDNLNPSVIMKLTKKKENNMYDIVRKIIADQMRVSDIEKITRETNLMEDLGADSIDAAEMIINIEMEFGVEIPDDMIESVRTVGQIMDFLESTEK